MTTASPTPPHPQIFHPRTPFSSSFLSQILPFFFLICSISALLALSSTFATSPDSPQAPDRTPPQTSDSSVDTPPLDFSTALVQNCSSIKRSLRTLQKTDSKTRVYLGTSYERLLSSFIIPLNMNIVKENLSAPSLFTLQADLSRQRDDFNHRFITYSQELETLLNIDCHTPNHAPHFAGLLQSVRNKRAELSQLTTDLLQKFQVFHTATAQLQTQKQGTVTDSLTTLKGELRD